MVAKFPLLQNRSVDDKARAIRSSERLGRDFRRSTIKALLRTLDFRKYLALGTVAGALDRRAFSLEEVLGEADSVWEDGAACVAAISLAGACEFQFHYVDGAFSHDGVNIDPPRASLIGTLLTPREIERNQTGAKTFAVDDELILLLESGVACHYRQLADGPALYKIDGRSLPYAVLEKYLAALCLE